MYINLSTIKLTFYIKQIPPSYHRLYLARYIPLICYNSQYLPSHTTIPSILCCSRLSSLFCLVYNIKHCPSHPRLSSVSLHISRTSYIHGKASVHAHVPMVATPLCLLLVCLHRNFPFFKKPSPPILPNNHYSLQFSVVLAFHYHCHVHLPLLFVIKVRFNSPDLLFVF